MSDYEDFKKIDILRGWLMVFGALNLVLWFFISRTLPETFYFIDFLVLFFASYGVILLMFNISHILGRKIDKLLIDKTSLLYEFKKFLISKTKLNRIKSIIGILLQGYAIVILIYKIIVWLIDKFGNLIGHLS